MFLLLFGLLLIAISLLAERRIAEREETCPPTHETRYLPRTLDMHMEDSAKVGRLFRPLFDDDRLSDRFR